jgi:two-component system LytT family sensor kinase
MARAAVHPPVSRWKVIALIVGIWLVVGLLTTHAAYLALRRAGTAPIWADIFTLNFISVMLWAAFTPAIVWIARRVPLGRGAMFRATVIHAAAFLGFAIADILLEHFVLQAFSIVVPNQPDLVSVFLRRLFPNALCYISVAAISIVVEYARLARDREARELVLSSQLADARLQALQAQLQPHFLFNTLSMIAEQVHANPMAADRMIGRLSQLLRVSLSSARNQEVTVAEERTALEAYLEIMELRFSGRARVRIDFPQDIEQALVPTLLLQPLVENAFRHGIERVGRGAELLIRARRHGDTLEITVSDNGPGPDVANTREGVGLRVVRERLDQLYGARASFNLSGRQEGGAAAIVRLPARFAPKETPMPLRLTGSLS